MGGDVDSRLSGDARERLVQMVRVVAPSVSVDTDASLARYTTMRVGGPADVLVTVAAPDDAVAVIRAAHSGGFRVTPLGGGSNVLVADAGVPGLVLRWHGGEVVDAGAGRVRADAGVTINGLVRWLAGRGYAGLEAWAGTPGTVGGAIVGNAHFRGRLISEHVVSVRLCTLDGHVIDVPVEDMDFGYDRSRVQRSGECVLSVEFAVQPGAVPEDLRRVARESLAFRKRTQPLHQSSAGCIFQNPAPDVPLPDDTPRSAGALVDRAGLKGAIEGAAQVSSMHGNFIVAGPGATAGDVRTLVERCRDAVSRAAGVRLVEEIVYLGDWTSSR